MSILRSILSLFGFGDLLKEEVEHVQAVDAGKTEVRLEDAQKDDAIKSKQAVIAAGVPDSPAAVDDWLSKPSGK